jgi:long-chain fatty acid transport protein
MSRQIKLLTATIAGLLASAPAFATNGYALHGIGMHAKGMGGASIAFPQDGVSIGQNPAASAWIGNRLDIGIDIFRPIRDAKISDTALVIPPTAPNTPPTVIPGFFDGDFDGSESKWFFIPEFAYNYVIDSQMSVGVSVFGNGGMNTDYGDGGIPIFNAGSGRDTGINLQQAFIVPTFAFKINEQHSIGIGANIVAQGFKAFGLDAFTGGPFGPTAPFFSTSPGDVTNNGTDWAWGFGVRVGWLGQINDMVSLGAYYSSRTWMQEFEEYKGLFAEQGDFDIPENFGIGIAVKATPDLTIAADIVQINYSKVDSIANGVGNFYNCPALVLAFTQQPGGSASSCLGGSNGPGFGWEDQTVFKLGVQYRVNDEWTVRAGWNYAEQPIPQEQTFFNVLAPGVVEHHLTLGASWNLDKSQELTFAYMHAFEKEVDGEFTPGFGTADIKMSQDSFGIQYSWKM